MTAILSRLRFRYVNFLFCVENDVKHKKRDKFWIKILEPSLSTKENYHFTFILQTFSYLSYLSSSTLPKMKVPYQGFFEVQGIQNILYRFLEETLSKFSLGYLGTKKVTKVTIFTYYELTFSGRSL